MHAQEKSSFREMKLGSDISYDRQSIQKTIESLDKTIALQPKFVDAWISKGIALTKLRRFNDACMLTASLILSLKDMINGKKTMCLIFVSTLYPVRLRLGVVSVSSLYPEKTIVF